MLREKDAPRDGVPQVSSVQVQDSVAETQKKSSYAPAGIGASLGYAGGGGLEFSLGFLFPLFERWPISLGLDSESVR